MATSHTLYYGNGVDDVFSVSFSYLDKEFVNVTVDGNTVPFTWLDEGRIKTDNVPPNGSRISINRLTSSEPLVDFVDGAVLTQGDLDKATQQALHISVEARDNTDYTLTVIEEAEQKCTDEATKATTEATKAESFANLANADAQSASLSALNASVSELNAQSAVLTHSSQTGVVHGVEGSFVGTENTQTLLNKTLQNAFIGGYTNISGPTEIHQGNYLMFRPTGDGWDYRLKAEGTDFSLYSGDDLSAPVWKASSDKAMQFNGRIDADAGLNISNDAMFDKASQNYLYYVDALQIAKSGTGPALDIDSGRAAYFASSVTVGSSVDGASLVLGRQNNQHEGGQLVFQGAGAWGDTTIDQIYNDIRLYSYTAEDCNLSINNYGTGRASLLTQGTITSSEDLNAISFSSVGGPSVTDMTPFYAELNGSERARVRYNTLDTWLSLAGQGAATSTVMSDSNGVLRFGTSGRSDDFFIDPSSNFFLKNSFSVPAGNPANGGYLYVSGGALYWRGSAGTVTQLATA